MRATSCLAAALALAAVLLLCAAPPAAEAQGRGGRSGMRGHAPPAGALPDDLAPEDAGAFLPMRATLEHMRSRGLLPTGLVPVYPETLSCPRANSLFAASTRGDGSPRNTAFFAGLHGGLDIPAPRGTPVLAVASGTVVRMEEGRGIGGIGLVLRHAPEDTGRPEWLFTEYKHLDALPDLKLGQRVEQGQPVARVGLSGTTGGHYGPLGHSHLHLSAWRSPSGDYQNRLAFVPVGGHWVDPLALFRDWPLESERLAALPAEQKRVPLPCAGPDGRILPEGSRLVWPLACGGK
jgi:murein DD-endopeptidase MepM/ murein hydrolase activator NlpD